ncbi:hypothetical protein Ddye_019829 [Dipteronia dyeriana]|uniref:J domain-containing protein n=1 Tax=Dipteronia dyeriana TaxID=168575 RepID=A0AAD9TYI1_9ROSI|nr:hypothetical protein Ddye_019829 [Dipteronia dyeriana]
MTLGLISYAHAYELHMAVKKTNKNYYAILGIQDHRGPIDTIQKNYEERVLMLHPDKCSSIAAEGSLGDYFRSSKKEGLRSCKGLPQIWVGRRKGISDLGFRYWGFFLGIEILNFECLGDSR